MQVLWMAIGQIESGAVKVTVARKPALVRARVMAVADGFSVIHEIAFEIEFQVQGLPGLGRARQEYCQPAFPVFLDGSQLYAAGTNRFHAQLLLQSLVFILTERFADLE